LENSVEDTAQDELLNKLVGYYEDAEESTDDARQDAERDRDYVDHKQWSAEEIETLNDRKQPLTTINRIKPKVDFLLGMERQSRTDPKAFPRTPKHDEAAEAATDAIRYVCENNEFDYVRSDVFENMLVEGYGGVEILPRKKKDNSIEIDITYYPWDRLFYDPHSRSRTFSDAKYMGGVIWIDIEDAKEMPAIDQDVLDSALDMQEHTGDDTYDDKPSTKWVDTGRKRIKLCSIWFKEKGKWHWAMFTKSGFLRPARVSPLLDEEGEPECGMELQSAFVDRDGYRYGVVRGLIPIQDEINKRRSKALHLLTMRQTLSEQGAVDNVDMAKKELAKPDGHIEVKPGMRFELLNTNDMATGQLTLLQEAKSEIDAIGANAALQGKEERDLSGRAFLAMQQGGQMALGPIFDGLRHWQKRVYRQVWNRIRQFWTEERWIRVTDDEDNLRWVGLNRPITVRETLEQEFGGPVPPELADDPRLDEVVQLENEVAELDVDILLEDAPDTTVIQGEQFEMLAQMYQANPQTPDNPNGVPWKMVVEASSLRNKDRVLGEEDEDGEEVDPEKQQMMAQMKQMGEALQLMQQELNNAQQAQAVKEAEMQAKLIEGKNRVEETAIKRDIAQIQAESNNYKAQLDAFKQSEELKQERMQTAQQLIKLQESLCKMQESATQAGQQRDEARDQMNMMADAILELQGTIEAQKNKTVSMTVGGKTYVGRVSGDTATVSVDGKTYEGEVQRGSGEARTGEVQESMGA